MKLIFKVQNMLRLSIFLFFIINLNQLQAETVYEIDPFTIKTGDLFIYGAADYPTIYPILISFHKKNPTIKITYTEANTITLYENFLKDKEDGPDVMLSSAMDLQFKLTNDGHALTYISPEADKLPYWAMWRNQIYGFSYEPAVIVINTSFINTSEVPRNRYELLNLIRRRGDIIKGRIGTFDIKKVGIGYLTWANDRQLSSSYGRLLEAFGINYARQYSSSSSMLESLIKKEIVVAYNVLGSYAFKAAKDHPELSVILPEDFTSLIMRSAFISSRANNIENAKKFIDFLLSEQGQKILADSSFLYPIRDNIPGYETASSLIQVDDSRFKPIYLDLSLLAITDAAKKRIILEEWESAMTNYP